ncbi:valine--tRNA ligase [bacterium]|nr:valine--tRNA ligase [bacterium]
MDYPKPIKSIDELPQRYEGLERERYWQQYWMASGVYNYDPARPRAEVFSVDTPPPTVSGALHIGHVYSYTQTDFSVRYQRMAGKHVFYPFGFDDNGLPSERLVERVTGKRAHEVGREEFIKLCKPILEDAEQQFKDLWQSLALSCDWSQFYTTIDERSRAISQASFIDLYHKGYIYRKEAPTMWCWADQTAIAQAEIEDKEIAGHFHDITFHFDDGSGNLTPVTIATTRPELIPACVAVFAHPDDERYKHLFGKQAITPLFEVEVPILPSVKADPEKGTGILMCCTFGDTDDVEHWEQFNLPTRVVVDRDGRIFDFTARFVPAAERNAIPKDPAGYCDDCRLDLGNRWPSRNPEKAAGLAAEMAGQKIKAARTWIREQLEVAGLLTKVEDITHIVRHSERGGVPIEIIVTPQWYIKLLENKQELIAQGRKVKWHPEYMFKRFEHWVEGLNQDWCISRQRYNGVPFPVWYDADGGIVLASIDQLPVNPLSDQPAELPSGVVADQLVPEADVMDTWATSSVTPLLNTHLRIGADNPEIQQRHDRIFPYDLRPQAHDIIRTWAFYTIAKAYYHFGEIPWEHIVISGHAQDAGRQKISKSKGHVVTPAQMVEKYTADNLRYWAAGCKLGTDTIYDEKNLTEGKRLITKIFNATKFALRHLMDFDPVGVALGRPEGGTSSAPTYDIDALLKLVTYPTDRWMLERLRKTIERATKANADYEFGDAKQAAEDFFWADFCDNYLELSKGRLYRDEIAVSAHADLAADEMRVSAQAALFLGLSAVLKLFAPTLPHISEECWSWYHAQCTSGRSIHEEPWPPCDKPAGEERDYKDGQLLVEVVAAVRKWHSEHNVSVKKQKHLITIRGLAVSADDTPEAWAKRVGADLLATCNTSAVEFAPAEPVADDAKPAVTVECELAEEAEE